MDTTQYNNKGRFGELTNDFQMIAEERSTGTSSSVIDVMVDDAKNKNNVIIPVGDHEEFQRSINEIILNTIMNDQWEFTIGQWDEILLIANSCPFIYGPAVYEAQAIATSVNPELTFDHNVSCNPSSFRKKNTVPNSVDIVATIFPNPSSGKVSFIIDMSEINDAELRIVNVLGKIVFSRPVVSSNDLMELDLSFLFNGIYTCYLTESNINKMLGKLTIMH